MDTEWIAALLTAIVALLGFLANLGVLARFLKPGAVIPKTRELLRSVTFWTLRRQVRWRHRRIAEVRGNMSREMLQMGKQGRRGWKELPVLGKVSS